MRIEFDTGTAALQEYSGSCLFESAGFFFDKFLDITSPVDTKTYDHAPSQDGRYIKTFGLESYGSWTIQFYIVDTDCLAVEQQFRYMCQTEMVQAVPFTMTFVDGGSHDYTGCVFNGDKTKMESPHQLGSGLWCAKVQMTITQEQMES